jgi:hypothetical protein
MSLNFNSPFDLKDVGGEAKSLTTTARSSLNDTTIPNSARSVSFREEIAYETYDPPSSQSHHSNTVITANRQSVLDKIGSFFLYD